jgi:hypothetical protein
MVACGQRECVGCQACDELDEGGRADAEQSLLEEPRAWRPQQATANVLWIVFLLSALAFLVLAVRLALVRRKQRA